MSEGGCRRTEARRRKTERRGWKTEVGSKGAGSQKSEVRRWKSEVRGWKAVTEGWKALACSKLRRPILGNRALLKNDTKTNFILGIPEKKTVEVCSY